MMTVRDCVAVGIVLLFLGTAVQPAVTGGLPDPERPGGGQGRGRDEVPAPFRNMAELASKLLNTTTNNTDSDKDGLPDIVERALGTDPGSNDSDIDRLSDNHEVFNGLDPNKPDSNGDQIPDYIEVTGVPPDLDSDGVPNAWDWDNDDDGVMDDQDHSPFAKTTAASSLALDINVSDKPTHITFQFRTKDPDHLRLILQSWNWPDDSRGSFKDLDDSTDDLGMHPILEFRADGLPDAEALAPQGIIVSDGVANLPVLPVSEFGNIVAFKTRMFYPESASPRHISANVSFSWKVLGQTDTELKALRAAASSKYISADAGGNVSAKASAAGKAEVFDWMMLSGSDVTLRASNGICLSPGAGGVVSATQDQPSDMMSFSVEEVAGGRIVLKAKNERYITVKADGSLVADAAKGANASQFEPVGMGFRSDVLPLATYGEDILLTGCRVEEDFGATAGVLYGNDQSLMVMAALAMDCHFLRNSTLGLDKVPTHFKDDYNMTLGSNISLFNTCEEAMTALASSMPKDALGKLPNGTHLPVILAMEDRGRGVDLSEMAPGGYTKGGQLVANCAPKDVMTTRTLKTAWYNTSSDRPMELGEIAVEILEWNSTQASTVNLIIMAVAWCAGEQKVVGVGNAPVDYSSELQNINFTTAWIDYSLMAAEGLQIIGELTGFSDLYTPRKYTALVLDEMVQKAKFEKFLEHGGPKVVFDDIMKGMADSHKAVTKAARWIGVLDKLGKGMEVLGWLIDVAISVISWFVIVDTFGWNPTGLLIATLVGALMLWYATALFTLALAFPPITTAVAFAIGLIDSIIGWIFGTTGSQMLINLIVKLFVKLFMKVHVRTDLGLDLVNSTTLIDDIDKNGLDVGDNITYVARFYGNVSLTKHGKSKDLVDGYIKPAFCSSGPNSTASNATREMSTSTTSRQKTTLYEASASVIPGTAMANFPMILNMTTSYNMYYENTWFWMIPDRRSYSGTTSSQISTLHFDVMPGNLSDFLNWSGVGSNDWDGDGISNTEENATLNGTSAWNWDTDVDGLGDQYELQIGSDPAKADTDGDGLNDSREVKLRTNFTSVDTDRDGLSDSAEVSGAVISFNFCGTTAHYLTNSDPGLNDTDGDGVADPMEYHCLLNPRSADTNGDGLNDRMADHGNSSISLVASFNQPWPDASYPFITQSPDGHIFGMLIGGPSSNASLIKYDTDGTIESIWTPSVMIADIAIDDHGFMYILTWDTSEVVKYDASMNRVANWSVTGHNKLAIDSRAHMLYVSDGGMTILKYNLKNMTLLGSIVLPTYDPWYPGTEKMDVDRDGNLLVPYNNSIFVYSRDGELLTSFGSKGSAHGQLDHPMGVRRCPDGDIVVADMWNGRIQKFSPLGECRACYPEPENNSILSTVNSICAIDDHIYVPHANDPVFCIRKLSCSLQVNKVNQTTNFTDTDGDGLSDRSENAGWNVTVTTSSSGPVPVTCHVTSDPNIADTDGDGRSDLDEYTSVTDARRTDSDMDGLSDRSEGILGTDPCDWDTDGDRLDDGTEPTFGSDPGRGDTDGEGLDDMQEFLGGSHPAFADSDHDGLEDYDESLFGSSLTDIDSDDDNMFDASERENGTNPNNGDTDGDGLIDGYETLHGTDPKGNDTDGDGLVDGIEISGYLDPLCNDTDGDGLTDGNELAEGLDPFNPDSDGNGILDSLDGGSAIVLDDDIILVADEEEALGEFFFGLSKEATVIRATPQELLEKHGDEPYIVLVGRPDAAVGTAGALIGELLAVSGDPPETMLEGIWEHSTVRYWVWSPTQTVVMLSRIEPHDDLQVLGMLKSMKMTVTESGIRAQYRNERSDLQLLGMDFVRATDSTVRCQLNGAAAFNLTVSRYDASNVPANLTYRTGLEPGDRPLDRYLDVSLDGRGRSDGGLMNRTLIEMYYTTADLDRNDDGDSDDPEDINESSLCLYRLVATDGNWTKLQAGQGGVDGLSINTTDFELYGREYQGVMWVNLMLLALLALSGQANGGNLPLHARAGNDVTVQAGDEVTFDGTLSTGNGAIVNFTWTFRYDDRTVTLFEAVAPFVFQLPGKYTVTLTVRDSLGFTASDSMDVTVSERPGGKWVLRVGPVTDENGTALAGALVNLTVGNASFYNTTDGLGMTRFELGPGHAGKGVRLAISMDGFLPLEHATNITSGRRLERDPPPLTRIKPGEKFTLGVGPVVDERGNPVKGALVSMTVGGKLYTNTTDEAGIAGFVLPLESVGKGVDLTIEKKGFRTASYSTRITAGRELEQGPPALHGTAVPTPSQGIPAWALAAVAVLLAVALAAAFAASRRRKRPDLDTGPAPAAGAADGVEAAEAAAPPEESATQKGAPPPIGNAPAGFAIEDIFLMYIDGRLILHNTRRLKADMDAEIMTSMLTAIRGFVRESLGMDKGTELGAMEYGDSRILLQKGRHVVLAAVIEGAEPSGFREEMRSTIANVEGEYAPVLSSWDGVSSKLSGTRRFLTRLGSYKVAEAPPTEGGRPEVSLKAELEFYQGFVRLKVAVKNGSETFLNKVSFRLIYADTVLRLDHVEPAYPLRGDEVMLGSIEPREKRTMAFYLDPQTCTESFLEGILSFKDARGNLEMLKLPRKLASVVCPILYTEENINTAMMKRLAAEELDKRDTKVFSVPPGLSAERAFEMGRSAVQHHDLRLVREFIEKEPFVGEAWYHGKAKGREDRLVVRVRVLADKKVLEFFVASSSTLMLTGMLAELRSDLHRELSGQRGGVQMRQVTATDEVEAVAGVGTLLDRVAGDEPGPGETQARR